MKRPLAITGITMMFLMLCLIWLESTALALCALVFSAIGLIISFLRKNKKSAVLGMLCGAVAVTCILFMSAEYRRETTLSLTNNDTAVEAVVSEAPVFSEENGRYYFVARLKTMSGERAYGKIRLSFSEKNDGIYAQNLNIGDKISFNATTYKIGSDSKDIHIYYNSTGVYTGGYSIENLVVESPSYRAVSYYFSIFRSNLISKIRNGFTKEVAGVIIAILTGDKSFTSDEIYSAFKISGVAHFMAVSGMHLSIWILFLSLVSDRLKLHRFLSILLLVFAVIFVIFLSSFTPSVMRAGLMSLLYLLGKALNKDSDGLNSLGFAAIILLFINPYSVMNVGFQLSFASVAAIFFLALPVSNYFNKKIYAISKPKLPDFIKRVISTCVTSVCISLSVTLFTYPVSVIAFGGVSAVSPITNLILFYSTITILILTIVYLIFSAVPFMATAISFLLHLSVTQSINITKIMSSFSFSYFAADTDSFAMWFLILTAAMSALYFMIRKRGKLLKFTVFAICVAIAFSGFMAVKRNLTEYKVTVLETGETCSCLVTMNGRSILVGLGENYYFEDNLQDVLEEQNSKLDAVVLSQNPDYEALGYITSGYGADKIIDAEGESVELFGKVKIENLGDHAVISGNGNRISVFFSEYLHSITDYDIILDKTGYYLPDGEFYSVDDKGITFKIKGNSKYKIGR